VHIQATAHSVTGFLESGFDDAGLQAWVEQLRARLAGLRPTLGLVFLTPDLFERAPQILEIIQVHGRAATLLGCSSGSLVAGDQEIEDRGGLALGLYHLPGASLATTRFTQTQVEEANGPGYWHSEAGVSAGQTNGWLAFADPFHLNCEQWLSSWNEAYPALPVVGGLASGDPREQRTQLYLNGEVFEEGGVALSIGGGVALVTVISQGCSPIGEPWTITKVDGNVIHQIGNQPAYQVLGSTFNNLPAETQQRAQGNLMVGFVINEYQEDFQRGDFLIRNLLGGDPKSGVLAVGALPRLGQSLQFQCRDAAAATEDLEVLLKRARQQIGSREILGGCVCICNGRGKHLFSQPHHDAALAQRLLGDFGLTGFFCNGEIGPVGNRNFLHGYTASLALFVPR
jgi:small ligand-binding sensory domain FIST